MKKTKYVVITPARNEEDYIEKTLFSMINQTILPLLWVIVDDGSNDSTPDIIQKYLGKNPWIKMVRRNDRGFRKQGGGVMEAFYEGYFLVEKMDWDFIVKLDGDLSFTPDYFQLIFEGFKKDPGLGIAGGVVCNSDGAKPGVESDDPPFHVRGATKIYRKACWEEIGELVKAPGWDTLDEFKANMKGWETKTLMNIPILHHRPTGKADGDWKTWYKNGMANYISGYHPLFMAAKGAKRLFEKPYFIASIRLIWGYIDGHLKGVERIKDRELIAYVRNQQLRRLSFRESIWRK